MSGTRLRSPVVLLALVACACSASAAQVDDAPGTRKVERLDENIGSDSVDLTDEDLQTIHDAASKITVQGARLPEHVLKLTNG
jgi:hypothetical protein